MGKSHKVMYLLISLIVLVLSVNILFLYLNNLDSSKQNGLSDTSEAAEQESLDVYKKLLTPPQELGITEEEYLAQVASLSEVTNTITMGEGCLMNPLIVQIKEDSVLKVKNEASIDHVIAFEDQNFFAVSAGDTREINATQVFGKGEGIYRYRCGDQSQEVNVGIMYIVAKE